MIATTAARPTSQMLPAIARSPAVTPALASTTSTDTWARSIWRRASITASSSGAPEAWLRRRMPAVSISRYDAAVALDQSVHRIPRRAGDRRHQGPLRAGDAVEQRRLADVGTADDRHRRRRRSARLRRLRKGAAQRLAQLGDAGPVLGRDQELGRDPEAVELGEGGLRGARVRLVDQQEGRLAERAQGLPHLLVGRQQPLLAVHHQQEEIALLHRHHHLATEADRVVARHQSAGVHHLGVALAPEIHQARDAVAGHAGLVVDDRLPPPDQAVEQGRLADVRAADHRDDRRRAHRRRRPEPARRRVGASPRGRAAARGPGRRRDSRGGGSGMPAIARSRPRWR